MNANVNKIKAGIKTKDPYEIAKSLTLPSLRSFIASKKKTNTQIRTYNEKLTIDGIDWSNVLNAFLLARDFAFAVSSMTMLVNSNAHLKCQYNYSATTSCTGSTHTSTCNN